MILKEEKIVREICLMALELLPKYDFDINNEDKESINLFEILNYATEITKNYGDNKTNKSLETLFKMTLFILFNDDFFEEEYSKEDIRNCAEDLLKTCIFFIDTGKKSWVLRDKSRQLFEQFLNENYYAKHWTH